MSKKVYSRWTALIPFLVALVAGLTSHNAFQVGASQDDAWYINMATALVRGMGYVRAWTPSLMVETNLPPGYPVLLAPLRWAFPDTFVPMQVLSLVVTAATTELFYQYCRHRLDTRLALLMAIFVGVNVGMVKFSMQVMTEAVYTLITMAVLVLVDRNDEQRQAGLCWPFIIGVLATASYFVRGWGIALVSGVALHILLRRRWRGIVAFLFPLVLVSLLWAARNAAYGGAGVSYGMAPGTVIPILEKLARNLPTQLHAHWLIELPEWFLTPRTPYDLGRFHLTFLADLARPAVLVILSVGFLAVVCKRLSAAEGYVISYAVIMAFAPVNSRYWVPLLPLLTYYFVAGCRAILSWLPLLRQGQRLEAAVGGLLVVLILLHSLRDVQNMLDPPRQRIRDVALAPSWIAKNTARDAVIMTRVPRISFLYCDRIAVPFPDGVKGEVYNAYPDLTYTDKRERFYKALEMYAVTHVLIEPALGVGIPFAWAEYEHSIAVPIMEEDQKAFRRVFTDASGLYRVYEVLR